MSVQKIIEELLAERSKLRGALKALGYEETREHVINVDARHSPAAAAAPATAPFWKSKRSAAARKAQSDKMKAIWAKRRRAAKAAKK